MLNLRKKFKEKVLPKMKETFGYKNDLAVPRLVKVVINSGISSENVKDEKYLNTVIDTLKRISGQKPVLVKAKKSISAFKLRKGMTVGAIVTLRGKKMYDFVDKLINVAIPRVRDFRGLEQKSINPSGSLTIGFPEHVVFPEIKPDEIEKIHGLEVSIVTSTSDQKQVLELLRLLGFPFKEK